MTQRYRPGVAHERMAEGNCPECGESPERHLDDVRFWTPRKCDLLPVGVSDRISQYRADITAES